MYGFARGVAPSRDVAGSMQNATEQSGGMPFAVPQQQNDKRRMLAQLMLQQQMGGLPPPQDAQPFDIYGG